MARRPRQIPTTDALDRRLGIAEELDLQQAGEIALDELGKPAEPIPDDAPASLRLTGPAEVPLGDTTVVAEGVPLIIRVTKPFPYSAGLAFKTAAVEDRLVAAKFTEAAWLGILRRRKGCYVDETPIAQG